MHVLDEVFKCGYSAYAKKENELLKRITCLNLDDGMEFIGEVVGEWNSEIKVVLYQNNRMKKRLALVDKNNVTIMMEVLYVSNLKQGTSIVCTVVNNHICVDLINERAEKVLEIGYRKDWMKQKLRDLIN